MPKSFFLSLVSTLTLLFTTSFAVAATPAKVVEMKSLSFAPKSLTVKVGESVEWKNVALTSHSATADDGKTFDTGLVDPKKTSKVIKFDQVGTFKYHCTVHGQVMSGTIEVTK